ncbi:NACHT domain-containing protein [Micromonospora echinofusca]|uniref:NACHT domain-containing protein n=1 Tax=Micromonospora echinofusca TaxID=47858 RepID=A0ABS3VW91_MICEH|nr:NACHT domain-containing protein [Micromonospora echinofusca]MBO4208693.1 NACHT domain-containing protein [Micromonospora echinofusca]
MRRRSKHGLVWAADLWLRQFRRRWRTRRERHVERIRRRDLDQRASGRLGWRYHRRLRWAVMFCASVLLLWTLYSVVLVVLGREPGLLRITQWCSGDGPRGYYCGQVQEFVKAPLYVALGLAVFLGGRYLLVGRWYRRNALENRQMVMPSAERDIGDVRIVGRDELCELIIARLRDNHTRRPLILVGGIGTGKTATLVRLAELLASTDVVPIGIELRGVNTPGELNFRQLARTRFQQTIDTQLRAEGEADKVWRRLWLENRLVVLADGLEEALADAVQPCDRDSMVRAAIADAVRERLPLVIASRPEDPLRGLNALLLQLEPLAEGAALEYVRAHGRRDDPGFRWDRISTLVKAADVADSPFHLRAIGQLYQVDRLDGIQLCGRGRAEARWKLLEEWCAAMIAGDLYEDYGVPQTERGDAIEVLSALACIGLRNNRLVVRTAELTGGTGGPDAGRRWILAELRSRLRKIDPDNPQDVGLAETAGVELNIVVKHQDGVRFQHGVVQAYLGARYLTAALRDDAFLEYAFTRNDGPGRELLTALTLYPQSDGTFERRDGRSQRPLHRGWRRLSGSRRRSGDTGPGARDVRTTRFRSTVLVHRLRAEAVRTGNRTRALEMFAAALEMDAATGHAFHRKLADTIRDAWPRYQGDGSITDRPLEDAKIALVYRFGAAARLTQDRSRAAIVRRVWPRPGPQYRQLFQMMGAETSYLPRLVAARELARGGNATVQALRDLLDETADRPDGRSGQHRESAQQLRTWLAPALFLFASGEHPGDEPDWLDMAGRNLQHWVHRLATDMSDGARIYEITLAQGFRLAANCRWYPPHRSLLVEEAEKALRHSRFWYSHLVLMQALTLLALPRDPAEGLHERGHGSDPRGLVNYWTSIAGGGEPAPHPGSESEHPLIAEAADLCVEALIDRHPERHLWVDEREIVGRVGSVSPQPEIRRAQDLWLPPSLGWGVLEPRAQRLLADVMLLLNLADRGRDHLERARRLSRASRSDLPPCLTIDRTAMRVNLSRRQAHDVQPGSTCIDDCPFRLCPLPPKGDELPYQMDETFCARQIDLVGHWYHSPGRPAWQVVNRDDLRTFWREMSERMDPAWRK